MNVHAQRTSALAIVSLIFGIVAWFVLPLVGAIVAVITGHIARGEIRRADGALDGDGMAVAGLVLGWSQLIIGTLALLLFLFVFGGIAWLAMWAH